MANSEGDIRLGGGVGVGKIYLDAAGMRGEGGWNDPRLVVPLKIVLHERPLAQQLALLDLTASLHAPGSTSPNMQIGPAVRVDLLSNLPCRSVISGPSEHQLEVRFSLTQQQIALFEQLRHDASDTRLRLTLWLHATIVWLRHTGNSQGFFSGETSTVGEGGWNAQVGMFSEMLPFWNTHLDTLNIEVEPSTWVEKVLPGLGHDRVRLVEVSFSGLPDEGIFVAQFDKARRKYDAGDYEGAIQDCRGIQNAWEDAVGATRQQHLAVAMGARLGWPTDDWHVRMLDRIWDGYGQMVNPPHHPEHPELPPTAADARLCLLLAAVLSEYLVRLRGAGSL